MNASDRFVVGVSLGVTGPDVWPHTDPQIVVETAARCGVESHILHRLREDIDRRHDAWVAGLKHQARQYTILNIRRDARLEQVWSAFAKRGIEHIPLKGTAIRLEHPEMAGRYQSDTDILVRRASLKEAEAVLLDLGFGLDERTMSRDEALQHHFHLRFEKERIVVELHWDIDVWSPPGFLDRLWSESLATPESGVVRRLAPEHRLLLGCLHVSRHRFSKALRWLADLTLEMPWSIPTRERLEKEAANWPSRLVLTPIWLLETLGVGGMNVDVSRLALGTWDAALLRHVLFRQLLGRGSFGLPLWWIERTVGRWLASERSFTFLLVRDSIGAAVRHGIGAAGAVDDGRQRD